MHRVIHHIKHHVAHHINKVKHHAGNVKHHVAHHINKIKHHAGNVKHHVHHIVKHKPHLIVAGAFLTAIIFLLIILSLGMFFYKDLGPPIVMINHTGNITTQKAPSNITDIIPAVNDTNVTVEPAPCQGLNGTQYNYCMMIETGDVSYCDTFDCVIKYADIFDDVNGCSHLNITFEEKACMAIIKTNAGYCKQLQYNRSIEQCHWLFVNYTQNFNYCSEINILESYRTKCYSFAAVMKNNPSYCLNLYSGERDKCYMEYAAACDNVSVCEKLFIEKLNIYQCYYDPAVKYGKMSYCENVLTIRRKDCYNRVLYYADELDSKDCKNIIDISWKDECYMRVAVDLNDKAYCHFIDSKTNYEECMARFTQPNNIIANETG